MTGFSSGYLYTSLVAMLLISCSGENVIDKNQNSPPTIMIMSHSSGVEVLEGYTENFRAIVSDDDNEFDELSVAWYVGEEVVCDWTVSNSAGESFCSIVFDIGDDNVIAEVRDTQGSGGRSEISVVVIPTESPTASITNPLAAGTYYSDQLIQFSGIIGDEEDTVTDLVATWSSNIDGELSLDTSPDTSGEISDFTYLSQGQHAIDLRVEDSSGKVTTESVVINVGGPNHTPQCSITEPTDRSTVLSGETVIFSGVATDEDIPSNQLQVEWVSDKDGTIGTSTPSSSGNINFGYNRLSANTHTITMNVSDEIGAVCSEQILLFVGTSPTVSITNPSNASVFNLNENISFQGLVSDNEEQANALSISWTSSQDGVLHTTPANSQGITQFNTASLSGGTHSITLSATDSSTLLGDDSINIRINTPPTAPVVGISPNPAYSMDTLQTTLTPATDIDGDPITHTYAWFENGQSTTHTGTSIPSSELSVGETWTVRVTPNDGYIDGPYAETSITISNTAPTLSNLTISGSLYNDQILTCSAVATDPDETVSISYIWTVNGTSYAGTSLNLSTTGAEPTDTVECVATVTDSNGATDTQSTNVTIANRSPVQAGVTITSSDGSALSTSTLSCAVTVTDADGETPSNTYTWLVNGASIASGNSLVLNNGIVLPNDTVICSVTSTDNYGASVTSSASMSVNNSAPTIDTASLNPSSVEQDGTLTCSATASDIDAGAVTLQFAFSNQSTGATYTATTSSASSAELDLGTLNPLAQTNETIACVVTATDNLGLSTSQTLTSTIMNSAPYFTTTATISPDPAYANDTLTCTAVAYDSDDGYITPSYQWTLQGNIVSNSSTYTIDPNTSNVGDTLTCTATAIDSTQEISTSVASLQISNSLPSIATIQLTPSNGVYNDITLTCLATVIDADTPNATLTPVYSWLHNGIVFDPTLHTDTLDISNYPMFPGDTVGCVANYIDGNGGSTSASTQVSVDNRGPDTPVVAIMPSSPIVAVDDLICQFTPQSIDLDGDTVTTTLTWTRNGTPYLSATTTSYANDTIPAPVTVLGDVWECVVSMSDTRGASVTATDTVTISPPFTGNGSWTSSNATIPDSITNHSAMYDMNNDRVLVFGGQTYYQLLNTLYSYDPNAQSWLSISAGGLTPPPLHQAGSAFDFATSQWFVFGGESYYQLLDGLYVLDTTLNIEQWDMWTASTAPEARRGAVSVMDDINGLMYVIGGEGYYQVLSDVWVLDVNNSSNAGAIWTEITPPNTPTRTNSAGGFDPLFETVYLFGGEEYYRLSDTIACLDITTQTWITPSLSGDTLPPMKDASVTWSDDIQGFVISGGESYYTLLDSVYVFMPDGVCSGEITAVNILSGSVAPHKGASLVQASSTGEAILLGGESYYRLLNTVEHFTP